MSRIKAVLVDDEPLARQIIREYLEKHPDVDIVADCQDAFQALKAIESENPDLIFLDIQMPEVNGFELLGMLENIPYVIFSTAYDQYALQAFEVNAVDYLLKPYVQERFDMAVERAKKSIGQKQSENEKIEHLLENLQAEKKLDRILVKQSGKIVILRVDEIEWVEALEDYVNLHTARGTYLVLKSMSALASRMSENFVRIHRSYLVNLESIDEIEPWSNGRLQCRMKDGEKLISSRAGAQLLKKLML